MSENTPGESAKESSLNAPKKARLIREEVKERHTTHWDLDYLSRAELEAVMSGKSSKKSAHTTDQSQRCGQQEDHSPDNDKGNA